MMDYNQISPNIFVGSHPAVADDLDELKAAGITAVLNLQSEDDFRYLDIDWEWLHADYWARGIQVRRVPIQDFDDDDLQDKLPEAADVLAELIDAEHTVYVHCSAGVNRSPSVVIAYLHWVGGRSLDDAGAHVQRHRHCHPVMEAIRRATRDRSN